MNEEDIQEIEVYSDTNDFIISQVCTILDNNNITYVKITEGVGEYLNISTGKSHETKRIFVSKEDYEKASALIQDIIEDSVNTSIDEELPEELRDVDESYFEELCKKGKISSYYKNDGTKCTYTSKSEFKKILKKEKNPVIQLKRKLLLTLIISLLPYLLMAAISNLYSNTFKIQTFIFFLGILIPCVICLILNLKINKMYKNFIDGKEYKNIETKISKPIIIIGLIILLLATFEIMDFSYSLISGNRPILSISEENGIYTKYKSLFYDYYKCKDGRRFYYTKNLSFNPDIYTIDLGEEYIPLYTAEIIKNRVYLSLPSGFQNLTEEMKDMNTENVENIIRLFAFKDASTGIQTNILVLKNGECKNSEINDMLEEAKNFLEKSYKEQIEWGEVYVNQLGNKNVGIYEYTINNEYNKEYHYCSIFSLNNELILIEAYTILHEGNIMPEIIKDIYKTLIIY